MAGDIRLKDYSGLADTFRRERHAVSRLFKKYFPRDGGIHEREHGRGSYARTK